MSNLVDVLPIRQLLDRPWPVRGEEIQWKGKCLFSLDLIKRKIASTLPGVLHEKRPLHPFIDPETAEVKPNTKIILENMLDFSRPIYKGRVGDVPVFVKFYPMPVDFDSKAPWTGIKTVNMRLPLQLGVLREARAYEKLEHLQGSVVPHCYGFYEYARVGSRPCLMQVLEFVEGMQPDQYCNHFKTQECYPEMRAMYCAYFSTLVELHKCGVMQRQCISHHLRVLEAYDPIRIKLVIFDFSASECIDFPELPPGKRGANLAGIYWILPDFLATFSFFFSETGAPDKFGRWIRTGESRLLVKRWLTFPEALTAEQREPSWCKEDKRETRKAKL